MNPTVSGDLINTALAVSVNEEPQALAWGFVSTFGVAAYQAGVVLLRDLDVSLSAPAVPDQATHASDRPEPHGDPPCAGPCASVWV